jgi:signal transduction histidine kinase
VQVVAVPFELLSIAAVLASTAVLARAFFLGSLEGFASLFGVALLALCVAHDALWAFGLSDRMVLGPFGFAAFVLGVLGTMLWRSATLRRELERRATELNRRTKELAETNDELRAAQSALVKKEQLAAIGELSAVVAHEVRNPLSIINNAVATLRRPGLFPDDRDTLLNILDEESFRLNRLVNDLLVYARPISVNRQPLALRDLVARAMHLADGRPDVTLDLIEPEPVPKIWADAGLLRQVVDNLVTNALEALPSGGSLTLTLLRARMPEGDGVELQIQDTGEGMDTSVRNRAFDPFFTTRQRGTGLGLAIVARIVDAHGGRLTIHSAAGVGTTLHVLLPPGSDEAAATRASDPAPRATPVPPMPLELLEALGTDRRGRS